MTKTQWLNQKTSYIPKKLPLKTIMAKRSHIFAKQGLNQKEVHELFVNSKSDIQQNGLTLAKWLS